MNMNIESACRLGLALLFPVATPLLAGEPGVVEQSHPDGFTELRIVSDGKTNATYRVDLKNHHEPATTPAGNIKRWQSYRFGALVHFNDNEIAGREFSENTDAGLFDPQKLDVAGWAAAMKKAGMKVAVLTTRHTSGFLLWDSATTGFDVASSPCKKDVVGEFVRECRKAGIAPGFYYCLWGGDLWKQALPLSNRTVPSDNARAIILAQLHELATRFGEIPYFWIDMKNWGPSNLSTQEIYDAIKNEQPNAIVMMNQHIQDGSDLRYFPTDAVNGEVCPPPVRGHEPYRQVGGKRYYLPFEFEAVSQRAPEHAGQCTNTPEGVVGLWFTYGEGRGFTPSRPIEPRVLCDWIKQAYDRGASNVLLSMAADYTGSMRPGDVRQLEELGKMLREAGLLEVPDATAIPVSLAMGKPATASGMWHDNVGYGPAEAFDGNLLTRWSGPEGARGGWLEVNLGKDTTVSRVIIQEGWDRTRKFAVQYKAGDEWKDAAAGTTIGEKRELRFPPVTARVFRLNVTEAADTPTIWEFQLFGK